MAEAKYVVTHFHETKCPSVVRKPAVQKYKP
jgi:hypothetical protein